MRRQAQPERQSIRVAGNSDRDAIVTMLAGAFADDPAMSWIFPDSADRAKRLPRLFRLLFDSDGGAGLRLVTEGREAATLWRGPGHVHTGTGEMLRHARPMLAALSIANAIEERFPAGAFWYLHIAGCDPAAQGRGFGGAAIRSGLERIAAGGLPVYLETATERNLGLYQSLGFGIISEWTVPKGGPRFWSMLRPAA